MDRIKDPKLLVVVAIVLAQVAVVAIVAIVALSMLGCSATSTISTAPMTTSLTEEQRRLNLESFDHVWNTVNDKYWDPTFGGIDWDAAGKELRPQLANAESMGDVRRVMQEMVSRLGVSHFMIIPADVYLEPDLPESERFVQGTTGITWRIYDGRALVTSVEPDSPGARFGVHTGWEILRVGDTDIRSLLSTVRAEPGRDSIRQFELWRVVARLGPHEAGMTASVAFLDGSDQTVELAIPLVERTGRTTRYGNLGEITVRFESSRLPADIGYIRFTGFFDPPYVMGGFNEAMSSFLDANGVIIDLRGNAGGIGAMALAMAGWLVQEDADLAVIKTREKEMTLEVRSRATTYDGPVAVLVDGLSGSASEFLSGGLQDLGRAHIVGSRTIGGALPGEFERLPNGDVFMYATSDIVLAGGRRLEHNGVEPDLKVVPTRRALLDGRDPVLEAAATWLRSQQPNESPDPSQVSKKLSTRRGPK